MHKHSHQDTQQVLNRITRAAGHLSAIGRMVEEGRDCPDVLSQLAAVRSAINSIGKVIIQDHMTHCVTEAIEAGDRTALDRFNAALESFLK